jgi:hypothetical protein
MTVVAPSSGPLMLTGCQHSAGRPEDYVVVADSVRRFLVSAASRWWSVVSRGSGCLRLQISAAKSSSSSCAASDLRQPSSSISRRW